MITLKNEYPQALNSTGRDEVFVGRIRRDDSLDNTFHVWCTSDNLLKGAALNAVQVLEQVINLKELDNMPHLFEGVGVALATHSQIMKLIIMH